MYNKILIFLIEIGFGITFNLVGTISLSELVLVFTLFLYLKKSLYFKYPILKVISLFYAGLLCSQILSEIFIENDFNNSLKGFAITIVSYLHFIFLFSYFVKDRKLIIYAILGMLAKSLIFGSEFDGEVGDVLEGEGAVFLKFYLAPIIINVILVLSIKTRKKAISLICLFFGLSFVVLGARSSGILILFTGFITYLIVFIRTKISTKKMVLIALFVCSSGYGLYTVYVNAVLSGKITAGNSEQIKSLSNPYNPFNLLIMGRTEAFVGWVAFMDKPLFGHGAWAIDKNRKYQALAHSLKNSDSVFRVEDLNIIPSHSVLIGSGMQNGIIAFIFMGSILYFFIKKGFLSINKLDPYIVVNISFIIAIIWNGLFSPQSHFRLTLPLYFSFLLVSYLVNEKRLAYYRKKSSINTKIKINE